MRSTPADAGKTVMVFTEGTDIPDHPRRCGETTFMADIAACIWDHPRRCGENFFSKKGVDICLGSPPRMRGKHFDSIAETADGRITPAYAGKTF